LKMLKVKYLYRLKILFLFYFTLFNYSSFNWLIGQSSKKIDPKLYYSSFDSKQTVILVLSEQADLSGARELKGKKAKSNFVYKKLQETAQNTQRDLISDLKNDLIDYQSFYLVNMVVAQMTSDQIISYASREEVQSLIADGVLQQEELIRLPELPIGNQRAPIWNLQTIGAPTVWNQGYKGQNVVVGGQDTGYAWEVGTIKNKYRGWDGNMANHNYNWHDAIKAQNPMTPAGNPCGLNLTSPCDDDNHGTHTMGTMVGDVDNNGNEIGVAPDARWIGCRNMEEGYGTLTTYTECFQWFLAPYPIGGLPNQGIPDSMPHVINNSWSCPTIEGCDNTNWEVMRLAVENLKLAGCVVVVSAGNSGSSCHTVNTPAAIFGDSYSVGATASNNTIASFSSRGTVTVDGSNRIKPDISAPGVGIRSCLKNGTFANYNGTSMAGPHVAGVVALMISANPALEGEVDKIQEIINQTAIHQTTAQTCGGIPGTNIPNNTFGYGIVNAAAAVDMILPSNYTPYVIYENSVVIDHYLNGVILTNAQNEKIRMRIDDNGGILIDTNPIISSSSLHINEGSLKISDNNEHIIFKSSNNRIWKLKINNQGGFETEEIFTLPIHHILLQNGDLHIKNPKQGLLLYSENNYLFAINSTNMSNLITIPIPD
jgi:serine protease AprX